MSFPVVFHTENCAIHAGNPIVTRTRRHTELTKKEKKNDKPDGKPLLCQRIFSSDFRAVFLHSKNAHFNP